MLNRFLSAVLLGVSIFYLISCNRTNVKQEGVSCTTYPVWLMTRSLCQDEPSLLIPAGTGCPHDYTLSAQDLLKVALAKRTLLISNGAGLDDAICDCIRHAKPDVTIYPAIEQNRERDLDPHQFTSPTGTKKMLRRISAGLAEFHPGQGNSFKAKLPVMEKRLDEMAEKCRSCKGKASVLLMHDTFAPLMKEMNLNVAGIVFEEHIVPLSVHELNRLILLIQEQHIRLLITEPQIPAETVNVLKRETGVQVLTLNPLVSGSEKGIPETLLLDNMEKNIQQVLDALSQGETKWDE